MKIRKIIEGTAINGEMLVIEYYQLLLVNNDEGFMLTPSEMTELHSLIVDVTGIGINQTPVAFLPANEDQAEDCPDYIEPPARIEEQPGQWTPTTLKAPEPDVICEDGACRLVFPEDIPEEVQEVSRKKPEKETGNWQKYIDMGNNGASKKEILNQMMDDKGCKISTAGIYYGKYVNPNIKYTKIETLEEDKPAPGKFFTDADRERLQRMTGIK